MNNSEIVKRSLELISEPDFIRLENMLREPNFFKIVGQSRYERWHSCFLGWLLDSTGSHLLGDYGLRKFLLLLIRKECHKPTYAHYSNFLQDLSQIMSEGEIDNIEVVPNEDNSREMNVSDIGRFDIFLTANISIENRNSKLNCLVEMKVDSKPDPSQAKRYADWLLSNHPNDLNLLVYLAPDREGCVYEAIDDNRWFCFDYQLLNDCFLMPLIDHPNLNENVKPIIIQYVRNLKIAYRGVKMAITDEEKQISLSLYDRYSDVFDTIFDVLVATNTIERDGLGINESTGRRSGTISITIGKNKISGQTLGELLTKTLKHFVDKNLIQNLPMPWGATRNRYIVTNETPAIHPNGRAFFYPVTYKGFTMESHYGRDRGLKVLSDLCEKIRVDFVILES